jgi:energy-converting hydrogenase Eha subunit H
MPISQLRLVAAVAVLSGLSAAGAVVARDKLFNLR